ncbi:DHA2 family efflux MFS transporter permease subunit [Amycolatopsis orientalis]|nr:DHA2 family efflux MFS transporter permease subunit [Amycolatopsis orientalis]
MAVSAQRRAEAAPPPDKVPAEAWRMAWVIVLGAFMTMLDTTVLAVGAETLTQELGAGIASVQWVFTAYLVALAIALPLCGWLSRRFGAGRVWLMSLAAFTVASALCALAGNVGWLIGLRVLQGLAAGLLLPAGQTVLGQAVGPARLGRVMGTLGIVMSVGPTFGPVLGGVLLRGLSWEWLFLINIPVGVVALVLGLRLVPRGEKGAAARPDWLGFLLVSLGIPALLYGLTTWGEGGAEFGVGVLVPLVAGIALLVLFIRRSWGRADAVMDLTLFRSRVYTAAVALSFFAAPALFGALFLLPLYFQVLGGNGVIETGLLLMSLGVGTAIALPVSGRLTDRYSAGLVAAWGSAATLATTVPFAIGGFPPDGVVVQILLVARGLAVAFLLLPATTAGYAAVTKEQLPDAVAQINIVSRVGGAAGTALFAVVLANLLPSGTAMAFRVTFWWLTAAAVIAVALGIRLWWVSRRA